MSKSISRGKTVIDGKFGNGLGETAETKYKLANEIYKAVVGGACIKSGAIQATLGNYGFVINVIQDLLKQGILAKRDQNAEFLRTVTAEAYDFLRILLMRTGDCNLPSNDDLKNLMSATSTIYKKEEHRRLAKDADPFDKNLRQGIIDKFTNDLCSFRNFGSISGGEIYAEVFKKESARQLNPATLGDKNEFVTICFYGPTGTGKTIGAEIIAVEFSLLKPTTFGAFGGSDLANAYVGGTGKSIRFLFEEAFNETKNGDNIVVLLLDEFEALFVTDKNTGQKNEEPLAALKTATSNSRNTKEKNALFLILTSNNPDALPSDLTSRISGFFFLGSPGFNEARALILSRIKRWGFEAMDFVDKSALFKEEERDDQSSLWTETDLYSLRAQRIEPNRIDMPKSFHNYNILQKADLKENCEKLFIISTFLEPPYNVLFFQKAMELGRFMPNLMLQLIVASDIDPNLHDNIIDNFAKIVGLRPVPGLDEKTIGKVGDIFREFMGNLKESFMDFARLNLDNLNNFIDYEQKKDRFGLEMEEGEFVFTKGSAVIMGDMWGNFVALAKNMDAIDIMTLSFISEFYSNRDIGFIFDGMEKEAIVRASDFRTLPIDGSKIQWSKWMYSRIKQEKKTYENGSCKREITYANRLIPLHRTTHRDVESPDFNGSKREPANNANPFSLYHFDLSEAQKLEANYLNSVDSFTPKENGTRNTMRAGLNFYLRYDSEDDTTVAVPKLRTDPDNRNEEFCKVVGIKRYSNYKNPIKKDYMSSQNQADLIIETVGEKKLLPGEEKSSVFGIKGTTLRYAAVGGYLKSAIKDLIIKSNEISMVDPIETANRDGHIIDSEDFGEYVYFAPFTFGDFEKSLNFRSSTPYDQAPGVLDWVRKNTFVPLQRQSWPLAGPSVLSKDKSEKITFGECSLLISAAETR